MKTLSAVILTAVTLLVTAVSCSQPERMAGIADRKWAAEGQGWKLRSRTRTGSEIEGTLDIYVTSNMFHVMLNITRSSLVESHAVRAAIEEKLAEKGLTLDSAVVAEIADAAVTAIERTNTARSHP